MDNFKTFQEDLASGRPAKKPVSSNLLKQRAKDNEKALKSGFMKMPDYVKKKFNEEEEMKPHKMYKGDKVVMAKNKAEHDKLNKQGYTHDNPKTEKVEEEKKNCGCGQDPCITYGKKEKVNEVSDAVKTRYIHKAMRDVDNKERASQLADKQGAPASVGKSLSKSTGKRRKGIARARANLERPIKEGKKPTVHYKGEDKLKMVKIKTNKPIKTKITDIGPGGKEHVVKDWSESVKHKILTELSPKTISSYQKKAGKEYSDLKQRTMSATSREGGYHKGYISDKEYNAQHDMAAKKRQRGKGLAMSKGKGVQKEEDSSYYGKPSPRLKKKVKGGKEVVNNPYSKDDGKTVVAKQKKYQPQLSKSKQGVNNVLNFLKKNPDYKIGPHSLKKESIDTKPVHDANKALEKNMGLKKTKDSGIVKTKGGYARKRTYTRESSSDNYNPVISDKRTKEKLKKAGLPPESPKVQEGYYKRLATDAAEKLRMSKAKKEKEQGKKQINQPTMKEVQGHVYAGLLELTPTFMEGKKKGLDGKACWKGYKQMGTKKKGGKTVDNCVKMEEYTYESLNKLIGTTVDKVRGAIKDAEKKHGPVDPAKRKIPNPVSGENIAKRLYGKSQKKR